MANLAQLKMLEDLNGFLLVDKPAGIAFPTVVKTVKRKFNLVKVGHGGSLDASASGLMILLLNDANKFVGDVMGADRAYEGVLRLGVATDTGDIQGQVLRTVEDVPSAVGRIATVLPEFRGDVFQTEPSRCAVRREGSAGYEVVDTGEHKPFLTHVYRLDLDAPAETAGVWRCGFRVSATKQMIPRALAADFGETLGCGACLESLRRVRIGRFSVDEAVPFDRLLETELTDFATFVTPLSKALA